MERTQIEKVAQLAGIGLSPGTDLAITGEDPILATPFRLGEGSAVAIGLVGQEVSRLWKLRNGRDQRLSVDVRHAAASLQSFQLLKLSGQHPGLPTLTGAQVTAIWECRDGRYIYLHGSFGGTRGILDELRLDDSANEEDIAAACRDRDAFELEERLANRGLCSAVCRTESEWLSHPQGRLLAGKPVVEVVKIGEAPLVPLGESERPLAGVRVLDLTRALAGPTCARTLAEHGADVLHIASPTLPTIESFEMDTGHGKRQAWIDLNKAEDADRLRELSREADVFSQGFRLGTLKQRGFGPDDLAALRPGIIYVSVNAYGVDGPWNGRPGWEQLAQSTSGVTMVQGIERPSLCPGAMNDYTTGYFAALGVIMALRRRATEGGSWHVKTSLTQSSMWYLRMGHDRDRDAAIGIGEPEHWCETTETGYGPITHVTPALQMSETSPHWSIPTTPLGSNQPVWLAASR